MLEDQTLFDFTPSLKDRKNQVKALDELFVHSAEYRRSDNYLKLLRFICRFPELSPFNAFLVHTQHPGVQNVATAAQWQKKFRRYPKRDARPLLILVPFGPVSFVYDVSETEGEPVPQEVLRPFETRGELQKRIYEMTVNNCSEYRIPVYESDFGPNQAGYATRSREGFAVSINKNFPLEDKYSTLTHELGHILSGHLGDTKDHFWFNRHSLISEIKEIEAESISFLVCTRAGLRTTSEKYLAEYVQAHPEFPPFSIDMVLTVSGIIERMGRERTKPRSVERRKM